MFDSGSIFMRLFPLVSSVLGVVFNFMLSSGYVQVFWKTEDGFLFMDDVVFLLCVDNTHYGWGFYNWLSI